VGISLELLDEDQGSEQQNDGCDCPGHGCPASNTEKYHGHCQDSHGGPQFRPYFGVFPLATHDQGHLVQQTAKLTAPITTKRIDGQDELVVVTRDLGGVRHDLENVPILAMSKTLNQNEKGYDLVVASGHTRVRVPNAGLRIAGLPGDMPYHVHLKWNRGKTCYELVDLQPAQANVKRD